MTRTAILFHSDAIESKGTDLVGRRSSGQSFLRGYLKYAPGATVRAVTVSKSDAKDFEGQARALGETRPVEVFPLRGGKSLTDAGTIFFPGPGYLNATWLRERTGAASCSLVGITHTVSTRRVIEGLHHLMLEPIKPWDAIICTSHAVKSVVETQLEREEQFIRAHFGARLVPKPQLPIIPLGIHTEDFAPEPGARERLRAKYAASNDAVVILTMGRLTSVEKANPVPLFMALEAIAKDQDKPLHLWMTGWANREAEDALHRNAAAALCPSVTVHFIDGRDKEVRRHIWAGADIFTLPVDSVQETFGLVPVEAMAAGLPVVMPDWNGFRGTIVNGETGLLVPTMMQAEGVHVGEEAARRFADGTDGYLHHLSILQQQTAIDVRAYEEALRSLVQDPERRRAMGRNGMNHARTNFDWAKIIPKYIELAAELEGVRKGAEAEPLVTPMQIDPFHLYRGHPTAQITTQTVVTPQRELTSDGLATLDTLNGRNLYQRRIMPDPELLRIAGHLDCPMTISELADRARQRVDVIQSAVLFLAKFGFVSLNIRG